MKKVKVEICTGTACFVMGSAGLLEAVQKMEGVEVEATLCCGICRNWSEGKPPIVIVDGKLLSCADEEKLAGAVKSAREKDGGL